MIYHFNAIFAHGNLAKYYNDCCNIVPNQNDWIALWDSDVFLYNTFVNWGEYLQKAINENPDIKLFSCITNRIGTHKQRLTPNMDNNVDIVKHYYQAREIYNNSKYKIDRSAKTLSGFFMMFKKETWSAVGGFDESNGGYIGVDTQFSREISNKGWKMGILQGMYVYHYYRLCEGSPFTDHIKP